MTLTKTKKKKLALSKKNIIKFKKENGITKCKWCGYPIKNSPHHFLCRVCWDIHKKTSKRKIPEARKLRQLQVKKSSRAHIKI